MNKGILASIGAYIIWGLFPLYWKMLASVPALEILAHRMVWSLVFVAGILLLQKQWGELKLILCNPKIIAIYTLLAALISTNWFVFIWAVNAGYTVEASLGYFITPLVNILFGMIFLREQLRPLQWGALLLVIAGVVYLTIQYGGLPWVALILAVTFASYTILKKIAPLNSKQGFCIETLMMFLPAFAYLIFLQHNGVGSFGSTWFISILLALGGVVTAVPLLLFVAGARLIPLSLSGILQFVSPTLQFLVGVFAFGEPFPLARLVGFSLIWTAMIVYIAEGFLRKPNIRI
jgi:chloramphenicol-sensitive protein RarD